MIDQERFERCRALVEDLAYSGMSSAEIAEKYGRSVEGIEHFSSTWAELIEMVRWNRYMELNHLQLTAEIKEVLQSGARELLPYRKIRASKNWGNPGLN